MPDHAPPPGARPPAKVAANARRGLALREKHGRGGTEVGVARAEGLRDRIPHPPEEIDRIVSYFARHAVDKEAPKFHDKDDPSAGYIAWLLWGSDEGRAWAEAEKARRK